jgi:uncharacterized protein
MKWLTLWMIRNFYWKWWTKYTPRCPQRPTCSRYGYDAVEMHGFKIGIQMAAERIRTCGKEDHAHDSEGSVPRQFVRR